MSARGGPGSNPGRTGETRRQGRSLPSGTQRECCGWWEHAEAQAMRGALLELFESWKDLNRVCNETAFVEAPDAMYDDTIRAADAARKRVLKILKILKILKKTEIQL